MGFSPRGPVGSPVLPLGYLSLDAPCEQDDLPDVCFHTPGFIFFFAHQAICIFSHVVFASAGLAKVLLLHAGVGCMACAPGLHVVVLLVGWLRRMACLLFS